MKLIKNLIITEVKNGFVLINTLNGMMDIINQSALMIIKKWYDMETIVPKTQDEKELYIKLNEKGYLSTSDEEEQRKKEAIIYALREKQKNSQSKIQTLTFVMTYDCNFRCPYCFETVDKSMMGLYLSDEQIDAALNLAGENLRHIGLFGGEPLLPKNRSAIEYIIKKAPEKSYDIITNGYYLDQYVDLFSDINISYVMVTLDGGRGIHDKRRILANGGPTFDIILENIQACLQNRIPIRIRMNIDRDTISESERLRNELRQKFQDYTDLLCFEISPMMEINRYERDQLFNELTQNDIAQQPNAKNKILSRFSPVINTLLYGQKLNPTYAYCSSHQNKYIVDPLGLIYPCLTAVGKREYAIGTFYPQVKLIENSVRNRNIETIEQCRNCAYSLLCGGGCPLKIDICKDIYQAECGSIRNDIHNLLPMLLETRNMYSTGS